jgi:16S rRNA (guanine527-N7)-methyltransferase
VTDADFIAALRARAATYSASVTVSQARELETFYGLLSKWNRRINLTALTLVHPAATETLDRLFVEPAIACEFIPNGPLSIIDLGSGAGSPALPIKILRPAIRLTMVETKGRKAAFLREAVRTLRLPNVDIEQIRFQALPASMSSEFDVVTVRALKLDDDLLAAVLELLKPDGQLITFGVDSVPGFEMEDKLRLPDGSFAASWVPTEDALDPDL